MLTSIGIFVHKCNRATFHPPETCLLTHPENSTDPEKSQSTQTILEKHEHKSFTFCDRSNRYDSTWDFFYVRQRLSASPTELYREYG